MEAAWIQALVAGTPGAAAERAIVMSMLSGCVLVRGAAAV
jgi:hypothetical protein